MRLRGKLLKDVIADDIIYLKDNGIQESMDLEYKRELPGNSDPDKKEFLADISAFANTNGGTIIFGIEEGKDKKGQNTGVPKEIIGLEGINCDREKQRLENIIRDGLEPKLSGMLIRDVEVNGKSIILLGIPRSLLSPHVIWFKKDGKFYSRNNTGKQQMDIREIKQSFLQADSWEATADNFRRRRVMEVRSQKFIPNLEVENSFFIHVLPLGINRPRVDLKNNFETLRLLMLPPNCVTCKPRFNLDGLILLDVDEPCQAYIQYFRNGAIEIYTSTVYYRHNSDNPRELLAKGSEEIAIKKIQRYFTVLDKLNIEFPMVIFLTYTGLQGAIIENPSAGQYRDTTFYIFDRDEILLPGVVLEDVVLDMGKVLKPSFDILWQSAGWNGRPSFKGEDKLEEVKPE